MTLINSGAATRASARAVLVERGEVDLFARRVLPDGHLGKRHFVARIRTGGIVPDVRDADLELEVVPLPETRLRELDGAGFAREHVAGLDLALRAVADSIRRGQGPRHSVPLQPGQLMSVSAGAAITGRSRSWWVRIVGGRMLLGGRDDPASLVGDGELVLLAGRDWMVAEGTCTVESAATSDLRAAGLLDDAVADHVRRLCHRLRELVAADEARATAGLQARADADASGVARSARAALGAVGLSAAVRGDAGPCMPDDLPSLRLARLRAVVAAVVGEDQPISEPSDRRTVPASDEQGLEILARSSSLHLRTVELPPRWWRRDLGPLLGWHVRAVADGAAVASDAAVAAVANGDAPAPEAVALVFRRGRYHVLEPVTGRLRALDRQEAAGYRERATQVQPSLPVGATVRGALGLGVRGSSSDLRRLVTAAAITTLLGLATPLVVGRVLGAVAQDSNPTAMLRTLPLLLVAAAAVAAVTTAAQNLLLLRIEGRLESGTQLALWDRLMRLPVSFFRSTGYGELANAVLGISMMREALNGITAQLLAGTLTALGSIVFIAVLNPTIGLVAAAVVLVCAVLAFVLGRMVFRRSAAALPSEHHASSLTNHLLGGVTTIKLAHAEDRAYTQWVAAAGAARSRLLAVRRVQAVVMALSVVLPIAGQLVFFVVVADSPGSGVTATNFFTINTAFGVLMATLLMVLSSGVELMAALPRLSILRPIVASRPERRPDLADPGDLRGGISLVGVSFAYQPDSPPVLDDVSFDVAPGEFVAVVGPSGSGKSTLIRLLLGFEQPTSGAVLYDEADLADLDVQAVRRQCGVVLQDGQLFAGSIRENICGTAEFSLEQVWDAAALAGLDKDIDALPMGMGTLVPPGGGTLSVGQRQRILIARALIHRPRILFFDEATSALDNRTQEIVTASTRQLAASRVVIAHRLSTIVNADRIVVLDRGRIVQQGTFSELMDERGGMFHQLASRQLVTGAAVPSDETPVRIDAMADIGPAKRRVRA